MCSLGAGVGLGLIVARYLSVSLVAEQAIAVRFPGVSASSANDVQGCSEYYLIMYHVAIAAQVWFRQRHVSRERFLSQVLLEGC